MSIRREWQRFAASGELHRLTPLIGDPSARTVLLSEEMLELFTREMEEGKEANRRSRLLATLQNIVAGRRLVVRMIPFEARVAQIGRLSPLEDCVWDIRSLEKPAVRVFCMFIEKDVLFAVTPRPRSVQMDWLNWLPLGDRSKEWKNAIRATKLEWAKYFPAHNPVSGDSLDEYLTNATLE